MKKAKVYYQDALVGEMIEDNEGYSFQYDADYRETPGAKPVSVTLPLQESPFRSDFLFPFFDGLIPEGWLLDLAIKNWKLNSRDRMGLLLACCRDTIGAVSVIPEEIADE